MIEIKTAYGTGLKSPDLELIGALCMAWSQFEFLVDLTSYHLRGVDFEDGRTSENLRDIGRRIGALDTLGKSVLPPEQYATLSDICDRGQIAAQKRNLAVHGSWGHDTSRPGRCVAVSYFKVPKGGKLKILRDNELIPLVHEAAALGLQTRQFLEFRGLLPPP